MSTVVLCPCLFFGQVLCPGSPFGRDSWDCLNIVRKLESGSYKERDVLVLQLRTRPDALWAIFWGSHHSSPEISRRCKAIMRQPGRCVTIGSLTKFFRLSTAIWIGSSAASYAPDPNMDSFEKIAHAAQAAPFVVGGNVR